MEKGGQARVAQQTLGADGKRVRNDALQLAEVIVLQLANGLVEVCQRTGVALHDEAVYQSRVEGVDGELLVGPAGQQDLFYGGMRNAPAQFKPVHLRHGVIGDHNRHFAEALLVVDLAMNLIDVQIDDAIGAGKRLGVAIDGETGLGETWSRIRGADRFERVERGFEQPKGKAFVELQAQVRQKVSVVIHARYGGGEIKGMDVIAIHVPAPLGRSSQTRQKPRTPNGN